MTDIETSALDALTADATPDPPQGYPFTYGGAEFRAKPQFDLRVIAALQRGNFDRALVLLLGRDQTDALLALDTEEVFTEEKLGEIVDIVAKGSGITAGESSVSSTS